MSVLSHKILSTDTTTVDKIKHSSCEPYDLGTGNTHYTVKQIAIIAKESVDQTKEASKDFQKYLKSSVTDLAIQLGDWLYNNYQYLGDKVYEDLRWPSCAAASRHRGIDCKSFTITASSILLNLNVPHWIREIRQPGDAPGDFTHVYVIIKDNGKTLAIDGTLSYREELPYIEEKDTFMSLQHRGLKAPKKTPASVSRAARMMSKGTTAGVRTIGAKKLSKWRYKGLSNPVSVEKIMLFQQFLKLLVSKGLHLSIADQINETAREMVNQGRFPILSINGNTLFLDNIPFNTNPSGLKFPYSFDAASIGAAAASGSTNSSNIGFDPSSLGSSIVRGGTSGSSGSGGFDFAGLLTGGSGGGGIDFSSLFTGGSGGGDAASSIGSVAGAGAAMAFGLPPGIGSQIGGALGGFAGLIGGGSGACGIDFENERRKGHPFFHGARITCKWRDAEVVLNHFDSSLLAFGWRTNHCPSSPAQGIFKQAEDFFFENIAQFLNDVIMGKAQLPESFDDDLVMRKYVAQVIATLPQPTNTTPVIDPVQQMTGNNSNTTAQNSANAGQGSDQNPKTFGMSTTAKVVTGVLAASAIAGTVYYANQPKGTNSKSKSKTK